MTIALKKWGNSLALRIPKDIAQSLHVENDTLLDLRIENGVLVVEPHKKVLLEDLVARIDPSNLHTEVDTGEAVGSEAW